ncbi:diguanylate cyclase domain-containing protein [Agaribacterium sp. ZY112]|uniref:sensor domain-containing diguanylate cyclase n=1 Tax=Agaribacterium sp. ZY112 TaxID=3233574 RepID=UPI003525D2A9
MFMADFYSGKDAKLVTTLLNASPVGMLLVDSSMHIAFSNQRIHDMLGWSKTELQGQSILLMIPPRFHERHQGYEQAYLSKPSAKGMQFDRDVLACAKDGTEHPVEISLYPIELEAGSYTLLGVLDVSDKLRIEAVEALNERLSESASRDALTELPNRRAILQSLTRAIAELRRDSETLTVAFLDLDGFKAVNDELGHAAGDQVLKAVAKALTARIRRTDLVGRLGGDEFLLVLHNVQGEVDVRQLGGKLIADIEAIDKWCEHSIHISASIGAVSFGPAVGLNADQVVQIADELMYDAKRKGRSRLEYLFYSGESQPC